MTRSLKQLAKRLRYLTELRLRDLPPFGYRNRTRRLFFPGCSLPSSDPALTAEVLDFLRNGDSSIGLWSACCGRPLRQFVSDETADPFQARLLATIERDGIEEIITACGNCQEELSELTRNEPGVRILNLYDLLAESEWAVDTETSWTVHHPCPARQNSALQDSFERLADRADLERSSSSLNGHPLPCCLVEGQSASRRRQQLNGSELLTYCAHCTRSFQRDIRTRHVLQVLFGSDRDWRPVSVWRTFANYRRLRRRVRHLTS